MPAKRTIQSQKHRLTAAGIQNLQQKVTSLRATQADILRDLHLEHSADPADASAASSQLQQVTEALTHAQATLTRSTVLVPTGNPETVRLGSIVQLHGSREVLSIRLVTSIEADPIEGYISDKSPLGQALLGKRTNECGNFTNNHGKETSYTITSIAN